MHLYPTEIGSVASNVIIGQFKISLTLKTFRNKSFEEENLAMIKTVYLTCAKWFVSSSDFGIRWTGAIVDYQAFDISLIIQTKLKFPVKKKIYYFKSIDN